MVECNSHLGSHIAEVTSTVAEDDATVDSNNASCRREEFGDHIIVAENDRSRCHARDAGGQVVHDTAARRILLEYEATEEEMAQRRKINQQLVIDSMNKSDEVRRLQLRRDADFQELKDKTDEELRRLRVMRNNELRRVDDEVIRLRKLQEIEVGNITKVQAAKEALKEIEGETATLVQVAKDEEIRRIRGAFADQTSVSADMVKVQGDIAGALRTAAPSTSATSNQAIFPCPPAQFVEKMVPFKYARKYAACFECHRKE
jgi:hypothetical protein